ncbi:MAG: hypothetical protein ABH812_03245 [bacterium]
MTAERSNSLASQEITNSKGWGKRLLSDGLSLKVVAGGAAFWEIGVAVTIAFLGAIPIISSRRDFKRAKKLESTQPQTTPTV